MTDLEIRLADCRKALVEKYGNASPALVGFDACKALHAIETKDPTPLIRALEFYANPKSWETETVWVGSRGGFSHDEEGLQPSEVFKIVEGDTGKRAAAALKLWKDANEKG